MRKALRLADCREQIGSAVMRWAACQDISPQGGRRVAKHDDSRHADLVLASNIEDLFACFIITKSPLSMPQQIAILCLFKTAGGAGDGWAIMICSHYKENFAASAKTTSPSRKMPPNFTAIGMITRETARTADAAHNGQVPPPSPRKSPAARNRMPHADAI